MTLAKMPGKESRGGDRESTAPKAVEAVRQLEIDRKQSALWQVEARVPEEESAEQMAGTRNDAAEIGQLVERARGQTVAESELPGLGGSDTKSGNARSLGPLLPRSLHQDAVEPVAGKRPATSRREPRE